jgi:D-glycero-D-manno-heptose 1,7-bisphosphate phosphatase
MNFFIHKTTANGHLRRKNRAVFLDRDGVINEILFHQEMGIIETPFTAAQFRLKPQVDKAIHRINRLGFKVIVVSNQPGVAMGHFSKSVLTAITRKMIHQLKQKGARLDGIYYCLHHPEKGKGLLKKKCRCRKPKPGLLLEAARDFNIDLKTSYMIGDSILDVAAGGRAGCKTLLLAHLKCDLCHLMAQRNIKPHYQVKNLLDAARVIEALERKHK